MYPKVSLDTALPQDNDASTAYASSASNYCYAREGGFESSEYVEKKYGVP